MKIIQIRLSTFALLFAIFSLQLALVTQVGAAVVAQEFAASPVSPAIALELKGKLTKRLKDIGVIDAVSTTPIKGLLEIKIGRNLFYADEHGEYLLSGSIIETSSRRMLTQERLDKFNAIDFSKLNVKNAVKVVKGDGSRKIAVFADPNCGYCKKLETELKGLKNATIYTFFYPILGADSTEKVKNIWCAADSSAAWESWMQEGKVPAVTTTKTCDLSAIAWVIKFARENGINGTPGIVFEDGSRSAGVMTAVEINKKLDSVVKMVPQ